MGYDRRRHEFQDENTILNWEEEIFRARARARMKENIISKLRKMWQHFE